MTESVVIIDVKRYKQGIEVEIAKASANTQREIRGECEAISNSDCLLIATGVHLCHAAKMAETAFACARGSINCDTMLGIAKPIVQQSTEDLAYY